MDGTGDIDKTGDVDKRFQSGKVHTKMAATIMHNIPHPNISPISKMRGTVQTHK
jgi:hypothetical protein